MIDIYNIEWEIDGYAYHVCQECNGICITDNKTGDTECSICKRINGKIGDVYIHRCQECGWHVIVRGSVPFSDSAALECTRCHARYFEESDELYIADICPTCLEEAVQPYYSKYNIAHFMCNNCKTSFHAHRGELVYPDICATCGKNAVQLLMIDKVPYKKCTECGQLYDNELNIINEHSDNSDEEMLVDDIVIVGSTYSSNSRPKQRG